jgi:GNAT superfamily N-acetyltransferase
MSGRSDVVLRTATATTDDAATLASLGARLFQQAFGADNDPEDLRLFLARTFAPSAQLTELADADRVVWIAEIAGEPVGYATLRRGSRSLCVSARSPAEVQRIYADSSWHGRGVGAALMQACIEEARTSGCDAVWLGVWERNPRGIAFYEKWGFRRVGEQRFLVGTDSQRDHVMALTLG